MNTRRQIQVARKFYRVNSCGLTLSKKQRKTFVQLRSSNLRKGHSVCLLTTVPLFIYPVGCINFTLILFVCGTDLVSAMAQLSSSFFSVFFSSESTPTSLDRMPNSTASTVDDQLGPATA